MSRKHLCSCSEMPARRERDQVRFSLRIVVSVPRNNEWIPSHGEVKMDSKKRLSTAWPPRAGWMMISAIVFLVSASFLHLDAPLPILCHYVIVPLTTMLNARLSWVAVQLVVPIRPNARPRIPDCRLLRPSKFSLVVLVVPMGP
jgi:hypothetical protein